MDEEHPLLKRVSVELRSSFIVALFVDPEVTWEGAHSSVNSPSACGRSRSDEAEEAQLKSVAGAV